MDGPVELKTVHGTEPQNLVEKILQTRIRLSMYWKEECFGLTAETLIERAVALNCIGGSYGNQKPSKFLCLTLKLLELQPEFEIILAYLEDPDFKYLRALAAFYIRLVGTPLQIYTYLEPLIEDYRKLRIQNSNGEFTISFMDEFIDSLLREDRVCDIILPRIHKRSVLEEMDELPPKVSKMELEMESEDEDDDDEGEDDEEEDESEDEEDEK